jgi:hypothetical protein
MMLLLTMMLVGCDFRFHERDVKGIDAQLRQHFPINCVMPRFEHAAEMTYNGRTAILAKLSITNHGSFTSCLQSQKEFLAMTNVYFKAVEPTTREIIWWNLGDFPSVEVVHLDALGDGDGSLTIHKVRLPGGTNVYYFKAAWARQK